MGLNLKRLDPWLRRPLVKVGVIALLLVAAGGIVVSGMEFRRWAWDYTRQIRYPGDVTCGFGWGQIGRKVSPFAVYDLYAAGRVSGPNALDYTPLRLMMVTFWAKLSAKKFPSIASWQNDFELTQPMLYANATAEVLSSILIFLLIRYWIIRMDDARRSSLEDARPFRGVIRGMIGAAFFWFNPAVVWDGHAFPQWDVWNAPFYLGAVLLACLDWWFPAGLCIVVGAFFKGQILLVAPLFLIWPLVQLRFLAILRFACGFLFGGALLALPWFNSGRDAISWYALFIVAAGAVTPIALRWNFRWIWSVAIALIAVLLAWPWGSETSIEWRMIPSALIVGIACCRFVPSRLLPHLYALASAIAILLIMPLFNGSTNWFRWGFQFGTEKLMWMATEDTYSLPWIFETYFHWSNNPNLPVHVIGFDQPMPFRNLMLWIYFACLILCAIGAAMNSRRNDARFLIAVVAPWLCWFVLITQLNNRYLIWASGFSGLLVGVSMGMTLLGAIVSVIGWAGIAQIMCWSGGDPQLAKIVNPLTPHIAWMLLLAAAIYLYMAIAPRGWGQTCIEPDLH